MPSTCCSVPQCSYRGGHVFPKDEKLKKNWIKAIRRNSDKNKYWKPSKTSVICRSHFKPTDFILETSRGKFILFTLLMAFFDKESYFYLQDLMILNKHYL